MGNGIAQSVPQSPWEMILGVQGQALGGLRELMNNVSVSGEIPYTDMGFQSKIGDLLIQQAPELLNEMSWGKSIVEPTGHGGRLDSRVAELMDVIGGASVLTKPIKSMAKGGLKSINDYRNMPLADMPPARKKRVADRRVNEMFDTPQGGDRRVSTDRRNDRDVYGQRIRPRPQGKPVTPFSKQGGYIVTPHNTELFDEAMGNKAFDMKLDGATDAEIFAATKTYAGHKDGVLRQEIAHGDEKYMTNEDLMQEHTALKEKEFFNPEAEFPQDKARITAIENLLSNDFDSNDVGYLKDRLFNSPLEKENKEWFDSIVHQEATPFDEGILGRWSNNSWPDGGPVMMIDNNLPENDPTGIMGALKSLGIQETVRHEGSHALTGRGGRHGGGSHGTVPNILRADLYEQIFELNEKKDMLKDAGKSFSAEDQARLTELGDHFNSIEELDGDQLHALYEGLSDESQSRLVQQRYQMTQKEMDDDPFYLKYPVQPSEMIMSPDSMPKAGFDQEVFESEVSNVLKKLADEKNRKSKLALDDPTYWD